MRSVDICDIFIQGFSDFYFLVPMERRQCVFKRQVKVNKVGPLKAGVIYLWGVNCFEQATAVVLLLKSFINLLHK